jgi:hypothetical protein
MRKVKTKSAKFSGYILVFVLIAIYFYNKNLNIYVSNYKIKDIDANSFLPATQFRVFNEYNSGKLPAKNMIYDKLKLNATSLNVTTNKILINTKASEQISTMPITEEETLTILQSKNILLLKNNATLERILSLLRIPYKISKTINLNTTEISVIIFENYDDYLILYKDPKFIKYLAKNKIGLLVFNSKTNTAQEEIIECYLNDHEFLNEFLILTKYNKQRIKINNKIKLTNNFRQYYDNSEIKINSILKCEKNNNQIEDILTVGNIDDIDHIFINSASLDGIWLLNSLFIDSIHYLSKKEVNINLKRYVFVDIDDIFLAKINETDFNEIIKFQNRLTENYFYHSNNSFKLNLGMSGAFYNSENMGDRLLIGDSFRRIY